MAGPEGRRGPEGGGSAAGPASDLVRDNLARQREYYGELLGDRVRRLVVTYRLSQAQLARVLGVSPAMLSQAMSGRRQKIANPAVLARMVLLERGARQPSVARGTPDALAHVLQDVRASTPAAAVAAASAPDPGTLVQALRGDFAAAELSECATRVRPVSPALALLLEQAAQGQGSSDPC